MATIKSYTNIEQSRKLAEILPIESADMRYQARYDTKNNLKYIPRFVSTIIPLKVDIPCWSLAALLNVLPNGTNVIKDKSDTENEKYMCTVGVTDDIISTFGNNSVDACVEMIEKLHKLKML